MLVCSKLRGPIGTTANPEEKKPRQSRQGDSLAKCGEDREKRLRSWRCVWERTFCTPSCAPPAAGLEGNVAMLPSEHAGWSRRVLGSRLKSEALPAAVTRGPKAAGPPQPARPGTATQPAAHRLASAARFYRRARGLVAGVGAVLQERERLSEIDGGGGYRGSG